MVFNYIHWNPKNENEFAASGAGITIVAFYWSIIF